MAIREFHLELARILGFDPGVEYPRQWSAIEAEPTSENVDVLLAHVERDRGISEDVAGKVRDAWKAIEKGAASAKQIPPAVKLQQPDAASGFVDSFLKAGPFIGKEGAAFKEDIERALKVHPEAAQELGAIVAELESKGQSLELRRRIHVFFRDRGLLYRIAGGRIIRVSGIEEVDRSIKAIEELLRNKTTMRREIVEFLSERARLDEGAGTPAEVARNIWASFEAGRFAEAEVLSAYGKSVAKLKKGGALKKEVRMALAKLFQGTAYEAEFDKESGVVSVKTADDAKRVGEASAITSVDEIKIPARLIETLFGRFSTIEILRATTDEHQYGAFAVRHDPRFGTDINYIVSSSTSVSDGNLDYVPQDAGAIAIYFHGSGLETARGSNIWQEANALIPYGVAVMAPDNPFHGNGPRDHTLDDARNFAAWVEDIVGSIRSSYPEKKVVLFGHSFGPGVILEYLGGYPEGADAAVLLSPTMRFSERMRTHYRTNVMGFLERKYVEGEREWVMNPAGDLWADGISDQYSFMDVDPPNIPILAVCGENDAWLPDTDEPFVLNAHYPTMDMKIVPGMSHFVFSEIVQDMDPEVRREMFREEPRDKKTRFVVWTLIDFLRRQFGDIVPLEPDNSVKRLNDMQRALLLHEVNPLFRAVVPSKNDFLEPEGAKKTLALWDATRRALLDDILMGIPKNHADFYGIHKGNIDAVIEAMRAGRRIKGELRHKRDNALAKLQSALAEDERQELAAKKSGFGVAAKAQDGSEAENVWTRGLFQQLLESRASYEKDDISILEGLGFERSRISMWLDSAMAATGRAIKPLIWGLGDLIGDKGAALLRLSEYERNAFRHDLFGRYLEGVRDTINIPARHVLSIGNDSDLMKPFRLFDGTEHVTLLTEHRFGSPESIERYLTPHRFAKVHRKLSHAEDLDSWISERKYGGIGGDFVNRIFASLNAQHVLGVYYFKFNEEGQKSYIDPDPKTAGDDDYANAEIRFIDRDGKQKMLDVIHEDIRNPMGDVLGYLSRLPLNAIYAGKGTTDFETNPDALMHYYRLASARDIPWVTGDRRPNYLGRDALPSRPHAFLNGDTMKGYDLQSFNRELGMSFEGSGHVYVARNTDFLHVWSYRATWAKEQAVNDAWRDYKSGRDVGTAAFIPPPDLDRVFHLDVTDSAAPAPEGPAPAPEGGAGDPPAPEGDGHKQDAMGDTDPGDGLTTTAFIGGVAYGDAPYESTTDDGTYSPEVILGQHLSGVSAYNSTMAGMELFYTNTVPIPSMAPPPALAIL